LSTLSDKRYWQTQIFLGDLGSTINSIVHSQRKYALDILEETGLTDSKFVETSMDPSVKLLPSQGESLSDPEKYRRLVGKLNYLTVTPVQISHLLLVW